ncbi:MAG: hypothetical protein RR140_00935 [Clostridia bacterium]
MNNVLKQKNNLPGIQKKICFVIIFFVAVLLLTNPTLYASATLDGITVWANLLLPALFPFFVVSKIITSLNLAMPISALLEPITKKLFKTSGASGYIFFISIFSGYPVGSKVVADFFSNELLLKEEVKRTITFTSNSGPMFVVGSVGVGMLFSQTAGIIILISHIFGAIINGIVFRGKGKFKTKPQTFLQQNQQDIITQSVSNSITSILLVGGFVALSFVLAKMIEMLGIPNLLNKIFCTNMAGSIFIGLVEMTKGCLLVSDLAVSVGAKISLCCFLISFGGISTAFQAMAFLKNAGIKMGYFLFQKLTHAMFSTTICAIFCLILC